MNERELLEFLCQCRALILLARLEKCWKEFGKNYPQILAELGYTHEARTTLVDSLLEGMFHNRQLDDTGAETLSQETLVRALLPFIEGQTLSEMQEKALPLVTQRPEFRAYVCATFLAEFVASRGGATAAALPATLTGATEEAPEPLPVSAVQYLDGQRSARTVSRRARRSAGRVGSRDAGGM